MHTQDASLCLCLPPEILESVLIVLPIDVVTKFKRTCKLAATIVHASLELQYQAELALSGLPFASDHIPLADRLKLL